MIEKAYRGRIEFWEKWAEVSIAAQGKREGS
jgi:hypothetical protein